MRFGCVGARLGYVSAYFGCISARFGNQPSRPLCHNFIIEDVGGGG